MKNTVAVAAMSAVLVSIAGCQVSQKLWTLGGWAADYDMAEQQMRDSGKDLLIFYVDDRLGREDAMDLALGSKEIKALGADYVCCTLARSYEPDRRYVAQYGVERAPALIRVHRDGTYHATTRVTSGKEILRFIDQATAPGALPTVNPHIPREVAYHWLGSVEEAQTAARGSDQPMLIVYHRLFSRDWLQIRQFLTRQEAHARLAPLIHARVPVYSLMRGAHATPFGALQLPAIVIAFPDGTFDALELPHSAEAIVRFADAALTTPIESEAPTVAGSESGTVP